MSRRYVLAPVPLSEEEIEKLSKEGLECRKNLEKRLGKMKLDNKEVDKKTIEYLREENDKLEVDRLKKELYRWRKREMFSNVINTVSHQEFPSNIEKSLISAIRDVEGWTEPK